MCLSRLARPRPPGLAAGRAARVAAGYALAVAVVITMAGCGPGGGPVAGSSRWVSPTASRVDDSSSVATPPVPPATPAPLVTYGRQGGIAGVDDTVIVMTDGSYTIRQRGTAERRGRLTGSQLAHLRQVLEAAKFGQIPPVNPGRPGADLYTYHVVYDGREVLARQGGVPTELQPVLTELETIIRRR